MVTVSYEKFGEMQDELVAYIRNKFGVKFCDELFDSELLNEMDEVGFSTGLIEDEE